MTAASALVMGSVLAITKRLWMLGALKMVRTHFYKTKKQKSYDGSKME